VLTPFFSPVWRGGAFVNSLDFAKSAVVWVLTFLVITNFKRPRQIIFVQTASAIFNCAAQVIENMVELTGIEPVASSLRMRRSLPVTHSNYNT
jgi:hypothetical protein